MALLAGLIAAIIGAAIWGYIAKLSQHEFSVVAVAIGVAVGATVRAVRAGPGDSSLGIGSAVIAILGCALGSLAAVMFVLLGNGVTMSEIFAHPSALYHAWRSDINALSLLFWAVAAVAAFRIAFGFGSGFGSRLGYGFGSRRLRAGSAPPQGAGYDAAVPGQQPGVYGGQAQQPAVYGGQAQPGSGGGAQQPGDPWLPSDPGGHGPR